MEASSGVLAEINPTAQQPRSIRRSAYDVELIDRADNTWLVVLQQTVHHMQNFHPGEKRTCGILVSPAVMGDLQAVMDTTILDRTVLDAAVSLVQDAKGLEFDYVIIADPVGMVEASPQGLNDLFVAMTRATQALAIVHDGAVPYCLSDLVE